MLARSNYLNNLRNKIIANIFFSTPNGTTIAFTASLWLEAEEMIKVKMTLTLESTSREKPSRTPSNPQKGFRDGFQGQNSTSNIENNGRNRDQLHHVEVQYQVRKDSPL